jgi:hypothetical protein
MESVFTKNFEKRNIFFSEHPRTRTYTRIRRNSIFNFPLKHETVPFRTIFIFIMDFGP